MFKQHLVHVICKSLKNGGLSLECLIVGFLVAVIPNASIIFEEVKVKIKMASSRKLQLCLLSIKNIFFFLLCFWKLKIK